MSLRFQADAALRGVGDTEFLERTFEENKVVYLPSLMRHMFPR